MNAITQTEADYAFDHAAFHELEPGVPDTARYNSSTAEKQKRVLTAPSRVHPITQTCHILDKPRQSAFAPTPRRNRQGRASRGVRSGNFDNFRRPPAHASRRDLCDLSPRRRGRAGEGVRIVPL